MAHHTIVGVVVVDVYVCLSEIAFEQACFDTKKNTKKREKSR